MKKSECDNCGEIEKIIIRITFENKSKKNILSFCCKECYDNALTKNQKFLKIMSDYNIN